MRERITFVQRLGDALDPSVLQIAGGVISGPEIAAAREDRLTFATDEIPDELRLLLRGIHQLHIRWASTDAYEAVSPFLSRLPPGFHAFLTPESKSYTESPKLCAILADIFGKLDCSTPAESFTSLPHDRFSHSTSLQYYHPLDDLSHFIRYAKEKLCPPADASSVARVDSLAKASSLDISYDEIAHALKVTATWPYQRQPVQVTSRPPFRTEVGILSADKPQTLEPHELGISGLLTVLGQDPEPKPTLFSFPSRHRDAEFAFSVKWMEPTGLHPTLQIRLDSNTLPKEADGTFCSPHAYFTLPRGVFADKYQLSDDLFLASKNLTALRYTSQPVDLEAPEYAMKRWGSAILVELTPPEETEGKEAWTAEIPLHLRYLSPAEGGYAVLKVPYPVVFWACAAEEGTKFPNNPFERANLGYDGLFGPRTVFWHVEPRPEGNSLMTTLNVPVLDLAKSQHVNVGTAIAVLLGFAWVAWKLFGVFATSGYGREEGSKAKTGKKPSEDKKKQ